MAVQQNKNNVFFILLIVVAIALALYPLIVWINLFNENAAATQEQKQKLFLQKLPSFLASIPAVSYYMLACAAVAVIASSVWVKRSLRTEKVLAIIVLVASCLLAALCLFQLM